MNDEHNPQYPPKREDLFPPRPRVVFWFKVYAGVLCVPWILVGRLLWMLAKHGIGDPGGPSTAAATVAYALALVHWGLALSAVVLLFKAPQSYHWIMGLVLICVGLLVLISLPASIALLIFWLKPETKAYYGRQ